MAALPSDRCLRRRFARIFFLRMRSADTWRGQEHAPVCVLVLAFLYVLSQCSPNLTPPLGYPNVDLLPAVQSYIGHCNRRNVFPGLVSDRGVRTSPRSLTGIGPKIALEDPKTDHLVAACTLTEHVLFSFFPLSGLAFVSRTRGLRRIFIFGFNECTDV